MPMPNGDPLVFWREDEQAALQPVFCAFLRGAYPSRTAAARAAHADERLQNRSVRSIECRLRRVERQQQSSGSGGGSGSDASGGDSDGSDTDDTAPPPPKQPRLTTTAGWTEARVWPPVEKLTAVAKPTFRGVYQTRNGTFQSRLNHEGKPLYLGTFTDPESAARAYDKAARRLRGATAILNFPGEAPAGAETSSDESDDESESDGERESDGDGGPAHVAQPRRYNRPAAKSSGYRGVSWDSKAGRFRASFWVGGTSLHLGSFDDEVAAARAYDRAARELHWGTDILNFPDAAPPACVVPSLPLAPPPQWLFRAPASGEVMGPFMISALRRSVEHGDITARDARLLRVWRQGDAEDAAMSLQQALELPRVRSRSLQLEMLRKRRAAFS